MISLDLSAAFLIGLMGGMHCFGMCGGIMTAVAIQAPTAQRLPLTTAYNLGRISSYMLAGAASGALGATLDLHQFPVLRLLAAVMLILMGLYLAGWSTWLTHVEQAGRGLWRCISPLGKRLLPVRNIRQALTLGMIWGWLPCGLVYSTLTWSLASHSWLDGALIMGLFGMGTLPVMLATGWFSHSLKGLVQQQWLRRLGGMLILLWGCYNLSLTLPSMIHALPLHLSVSH